ncbi:MAG TPA: MraY family glycosyltransferase [Anaerolineae bacterium]|nr:MraY family glycosyltransferase [Anaerolineae bacterium]HNT04580.1 MraY family glycosyltransferase [Anaerolineae bacterium]
MTDYMLIIAGALVIVLGSMPLVRRAALRWGFIAQPSARGVHTRSTPRLGGVAIYLGCIVALLVFGDRFYVAQVVSMLVGATLVSFLGVWDDRQSLRPLVKLAGQILAATILYVSGIRVGFLHNTYLNLAATMLWVVGITNALNLLDNMDGLSGGVATVACVFFLLLAAMSGQYLVASLAAALLGACLGFLYYNFNPATIFMGDSGSLFIGFMLAALGIKLRFPDNVSFVTWMIPVVVLGLPIFDTALVVISRLRRGVNPLSTPGKDHTSHRLVLMGATQRESVLILYLVCCALGVAAMFLTQASIIEGYFIGALLLCCGVYALWRLEQVQGDFVRRSRRASTGTEPATLSDQASKE